MYLFKSFVFYARCSSQDRDRGMRIYVYELLKTLCLCLSFLVRSRILGKILRVSKMLVHDRKCGPQMSIFSLTSCRGSWGRI